MQKKKRENFMFCVFDFAFAKSFDWSHTVLYEKYLTNHINPCKCDRNVALSLSGTWMNVHETFF